MLYHIYLVHIIKYPFRRYYLGILTRGLPKVTFSAEAKAQAEGGKKFVLRLKGEAEAEGGNFGKKLSYV